MLGATPYLNQTLPRYQNTRLTYISDKLGSSSLLSSAVTRRTGVQLATLQPYRRRHVLQWGIIVKQEDDYPCALINRANSLHAPTFFPRWNEWSIDHAFIGHRLYSIIGVSRDELLSPSSNTKTVAPDHLSYDYADSSQARFSYVMFRHGSAIDRLAAGSGHRLPPSRVGITWFACSQRVENVSWFLCAVAFPESPERLAND